MTSKAQTPNNTLTDVLLSTRFESLLSLSCENGKWNLF